MVPLFDIVPKHHEYRNQDNLCFKRSDNTGIIPISMLLTQLVNLENHHNPNYAWFVKIAPMKLKLGTNQDWPEMTEIIELLVIEVMALARVTEIETRLLMLWM